MSNNGLRGSDKKIFDLIQKSENRVKISAPTIAYVTGYHANTVFRALRRLTLRGYLERRRERPGQPYTYNVCRKQNGGG